MCKGYGERDKRRLTHQVLGKRNRNLRHETAALTGIVANGTHEKVPFLLRDVLRNINRVLVRIQHAIVRVGDPPI